MSRHELKPHESAPPGRTVLIGWDSIGTYFVSVTDHNGEAARDVLFAGADRYDISEVATVIELVTPYARVPWALRKALIGDRVAEGYQCPACRGRGARILPSSSDETECSPCEGTGKVQCAHGLTLASGECTRCTSGTESPAAADAAREFDWWCASMNAALNV